MGSGVNGYQRDVEASRKRKMQRGMDGQRVRSNGGGGAYERGDLKSTCQVLLKGKPSVNNCANEINRVLNG
jgi:hypothetical protein